MEHRQDLSDLRESAAQNVQSRIALSAISDDVKEQEQDSNETKKTDIKRVYDKPRDEPLAGTLVGVNVEPDEAYTTASTPLQYRSHIERNLGWPAKLMVMTAFPIEVSKHKPATSQILSVMFPFLTLRKLKATVGTTSSLHWHSSERMFQLY